MATPIRVGIVGAGQIARVQHIPALAASADLDLAAIANPVAVPVPDGVSLHGSLDAMLAQRPEIEAVAICTPPQIRYGLARTALAAGKHVLLEKPPAATSAEIAALAGQAADRGLTLFTAWHALFNPAVHAAREILAARGAQGMRMVWKEDVDRFHPGVDWFWQPGGMGVFDPGINAFSILVTVMPEPVFLREATLTIPSGAHAPSSARLRFATPTQEEGFTGELDWHARHGETWTIDWMLRDGGAMQLERGGAELRLDGRTIVSEPDTEYRRLYARFAELIRSGRSEVEIRPLQLVADAFMLARFEPATEARA